jgi:Carbohydrate family 9 binding domain-like
MPIRDITRTGGLRVFILLICGSAWSWAGAQTVQSLWYDSDPPLDTNPTSRIWLGSVPVYLNADPHGKPDPKYRTEIRSRWTSKNLYLLFICPYEQLYLRPHPDTSTETNELWNWDVAEAFIGSDFEHIRRYKEFEISPQGEWVDLEIDLDHPHAEGGWRWNSGFEVSARVDQTAQVWYGAMRIPYFAIDSRPATAGNVLRINLFRSQGPPSARHQLAWQATMSNSFHVPERFGTLQLVKKEP